MSGWAGQTPPFGFTTDDELYTAFHAHCERNLRDICLSSTISRQRIHDVFGAWREDLGRGKDRNFREAGISPGHVKAAAFLTYWLRREAPIVDVVMSDGQYSELTLLSSELNGEDDSTFTEVPEARLKEIKLSTGISLAELLENRQRVFAYGNELLAFTFGFSLAKRYEEQRLKEHKQIMEIAMPPMDFVDDICCLFKFKSVSPHAVDFIYRALLMVPQASVIV